MSVHLYTLLYYMLKLRSKNRDYEMNRDTNFQIKNIHDRVSYRLVVVVEPIVGESCFCQGTYRRR